VNILLDNCVPYRPKQLFTGHNVTHTSDIGYEALRNGALIATAARQFEAMVTTAKKIRYEQNLDKLPIAIIELNTKFTRFDDLKTLAPYLEAALTSTGKYRFVSVSPDGALDLLGKI
jgi:hypothetical protein